jgi:uncharacterized ferritin-like protein (DUF455 family)
MHAPAPRSPPSPVSLRAQALQALCLSDPGDKVAATHALFDAWQAGETVLDAAEALMPDATKPLPGRPERPELLAPVDVPQRSPFTPPGLAMLLHAVTHIEFNAINAVFHIGKIYRLPPGGICQS